MKKMQFNRVKVGASLLGAAALAASAGAYAALPVSVAPAIAGIGTDGQAVFDLVIPIIGTFISLVVTIKLIKRFTSKI